MSKRKLILQKDHVTNVCFYVYLYFVIDFFLRFSQRIPGYGALRPTLVLIVLIAFLLLLQKKSFKRQIQDPIFKIFYLLLIYLLVSLPFVEWPGSVIRNNIEVFVKAVVFLVFTALIVDTESRFKKFLTVFLGCQLFRVLEPLYLNITQGYLGSRTHIGGGEFAGRLAGAPADVINSNELGFVIATVIPFLHYLLWHGRWYGKLLYLILLPLLLYALILTMSRGAFIALLVVVWLILKDSQQKLLLIITLLIMSVAAWSMMSDVQQERYTSIFGGEGAQAKTADRRIDGIIWEFKLGLNKPGFGHGLGTTPEAKTHIVGKRQASHNLYAELLIEIGIIGAVIFLIFLKRIYNQFNVNRLKLFRLQLDHNDFYFRLNKAMVALFWMYAVYSINYWGLSQYYWYLFAGLTIAFTGVIDQQLKLNSSENGLYSKVVFKGDLKK